MCPLIAAVNFIALTVVTTESVTPSLPMCKVVAHRHWPHAGFGVVRIELLAPFPGRRS